MDALIAIENLTVSRGNTVLAANVSHKIMPGTVLLLTGANGSGKTSFLRALAGLLTPAEGSVTGTNDFHWIDAQHLAPSLETPRQYLSYQAALAGKKFQLASDPFAITQYLDTPLNRLSTGWRQRVKLSRLLLAECALWFLDEPADGLDAGGERILQQLIETRAQGGAVIIATHDPHLWPRAQAMTFGKAA